MNKKILMAGAGIIAAAGLFVLFAKKDRRRDILKSETIEKPENPLDANMERNEAVETSADTSPKVIEVEAEPTVDIPEKEQTEQPAEMSIPETAGQKVQTSRRVGQYDDEMHLIAEYESASAAAKAVGSNRTSIRDAANGKQKHAAGYVWKYLD